MSVRRCLAFASLCLSLHGTSLAAQQPVKIGDVTSRAGVVPHRAVGYGLVVGLDGTGDRSLGGRSGSAHTVRSVVNLLRRFGVEVPEEHLRMRNVAAVLVTAELSPFSRTGSRFDVQVASMGDATSLEGGMLWTTPLSLDIGTDIVATAQGALPRSVSDRKTYTLRGARTVTVDAGGVLEQPLPKPQLGAEANVMRLALHQPDVQLAVRIAEAINQSEGEGTAQAEDPGTVRVTLPENPGAAMVRMATVDGLDVNAPSVARVLVDSRTGAVIVGGSIAIGAATVSHDGVTLTIGGGDLQSTANTPPPPAPAGALQNPALLGNLQPTASASENAKPRVHATAGSTVQQVAASLHDAGVEPKAIATIFRMLRQAGVLNAEVVIR